MSLKGRILKLKYKRPELIPMIMALVLMAAGTSPVEAGLTAQHERRIGQANRLLAEVDRRSANDICDEFNKTAAPEANVKIYEAVAATYDDLVKSKDIQDAAQKVHLYDQIRLNVAYIQFGGDPEYDGGKLLDRWIRQALVRYLPKDLMA
ncbi:MAG: hypothetical protein AABZ57_07910, partial [Candidatus Margulisiibacteriota bacterium]